MAIVVKHEASGKTYGTVAQQTGAAKAAKEAREREAQRQFQREQMVMQADLQAKSRQQDFQNQMALKEVSDKQDLVKAAALKDIELEAKAKEQEQTVQLRKELMGQVDPYGTIKISEAMATEAPQYDYSGNPKLQKQVDTITKGQQTLQSYLSAGLFDNRMDEYKMLQEQLQKQLDSVNSMAKPVKNLKQEFESSTFGMTNPLDGTTNIMQRDKNNKWAPIFKAGKSGALEQNSFDLLDISAKEKIVNSVVKNNEMLKMASNSERINAAREYYNALVGGGSVTQTTPLDVLPPEKKPLVQQILNMSGKQLTQDQLTRISQLSPEQLQDYIQKKYNQQNIAQ
jgi:hypothetical protein